VRSTVEQSGGYKTDELPGRLTRSKVWGGIQVEFYTDNSKVFEKKFLIHSLRHCCWKQRTKTYDREFHPLIITDSVDPMSFYMRISGLFSDEARFGSAYVPPFGPCCGTCWGSWRNTRRCTSRMITVQIVKVQFGDPMNLVIGERGWYPPVTNRGHGRLLRE